jgi:predicted nucleotidyltransferase
MERRSVEAVVQALNQAGVRYLVVGGLAVVAHGLVRFTADIDVVLEPDPAALRRAIAAMSSLGYRPRAPVEFADFADAAKRAQWVREKGLTVFSVFSPQHPATEIDLFVEAPFDFERVYARARRFEVAPGIEASFVGLADLIEMKRRAGRPQDLQDVDGLESLGGADG